jgi:hypothetical protein
LLQQRRGDPCAYVDDEAAVRFEREADRQSRNSRRERSSQLDVELVQKARVDLSLNGCARGLGARDRGDLCDDLRRKTGV